MGDVEKLVHEWCDKEMLKLMEKTTCELEEKCRKELKGYGNGIPERCKECTDNVKFLVKCLDEQSRGVITDYGEGC